MLTTNNLNIEFEKKTSNVTFCLLSVGSRRNWTLRFV